MYMYIMLHCICSNSVKSKTVKKSPPVMDLADKNKTANLVHHIPSFSVGKVCLFSQGRAGRSRCSRI